jgi:hypothetical protein
LPFFVIPRIYQNLIMPVNPVSILKVAPDPYFLPSFRNPHPAYFPMTRGLADYGGRGVNRGSIIPP